MIQNIGGALRQAWAGSAILVVLGTGAGSSASPAHSIAPNLWKAPDEERGARLAHSAMLPPASELVAFKPAPTPAPIKPRYAASRASARSAPLPAAPVGPAVAPAGNSAGYAFGYCTWWVSHKRSIPWQGMAYQWWSLARAYGFAEGSTPRVGAIMVMAAGMAGASATSGHVGYVESVNSDGSFVVSEMNWYGAGGGWGKVDYRTVTSMAGILGFIY